MKTAHRGLAGRSVPGHFSIVARRRLILAAFVAAQAAGCSCGEGKEESGPPPPAVELAEAVLGEMPEIFQTIGTVESINTVQVRARVGGQLLAIGFEPGSVVEAGQKLFQLDPRPFERALEAAEASLAEARTQAAQLRTDARRYQELARRGAVATQQAEQSQAAARAAVSSVEAAEAMVQQAQLELDFTAIEAPVHGRTGDLSVRIGDQVEPNSADPLVTIQVMDPIYVRFSLPADHLASVRQAAQEGELTVRSNPRGQPDLAREGELRFIDNQVDPSTGTILLKALFENPEETFWPGEPTDVQLLIRTLYDVALIPSSALQIGPEGPFVYVFRPGDSTVEMRAIRPGPESEGRTAILEGVAPGEQVVVSGHLRLRPGIEVRVQESPPGEAEPPSPPPEPEIEPAEVPKAVQPGPPESPPEPAP